jgi:hypothetical protein
LLRWLAKRLALSQNLLSLRHLRPCGWGRASETILPQCSQRLSSSAEVTSQYICGYMALSKLSNAQILRSLIGSARQLALSCCIAGRHSSCVVLSTLCPAICRPVHRYSSSGQTSRSLSTKILSLGRGDCIHEEGNLCRSTRYGYGRQSASRSCPSSRQIVLVYSSDKPMVPLL